MPERGRLAFAGRAVALLLAAGAAFLVFAVFYGRIRLFLPLRLQFVTLFLLSTLAPLYGALRLGSHALRTGRAVDESVRVAAIIE